MKLLKKERERIKKKLPAGWKQRISQELGLKEETVRLIMGGHRNNPDVVKRAIELSALSEPDKTELLNKISQ